MKRGSKELNLCVALVTLGSYPGVKYRHGVQLVSFFSRDMWVLLWVNWGRISPTCGAKNIKSKRSIGESWWPAWRLWGI